MLLRTYKVKAGDVVAGVVLPDVLHARARPGAAEVDHDHACNIREEVTIVTRRYMQQRTAQTPDTHTRLAPPV